MMRSLRRILCSSLLILCWIGGTGAAKRNYTHMRVLASGYCPCTTCCGHLSPGITKTGRSASKAGIATQDSVIPTGSRVDIPLDSYYNRGRWILADDVGGAIKGRRIDIRFKTHQEAKKFGKRWMVIRVWEK